jgi:RIO-like serine/threonine protein kinase
MTKRQDIEIEKEIGRGRESVVYAALKGGTTRVAVKKSRREDKMRGEAQRLRVRERREKGEMTKR